MSTKHRPTIQQGYKNQTKVIINKKNLKIFFKNQIDFLLLNYRLYKTNSSFFTELNGLLYKNKSFTFADIDLLT